MKVLFAIKSLQVEGGGAERVLVSVANALAQRRCEVTVVTLDRPHGTTFYPVARAVSRRDLDLGVPGQSTPRSRMLRFVREFRGLVQELAPDVVVAFMHSIYVPAALGLAGTGVPLVASEHIDAAHYKGRYVEAVLAKLAQHSAALITVPASAIHNALEARLRSKTVVIPNPIDLFAFERVSSLSTEATPPYIILAIGRFMEQKNHLELIEAFGRVSEQFPSWKLRLVGDGELRAAIERKIAACGLSEKVELPGSVKDIVSEYGRSQFVVMPSLYESFGLVTAEALASGRPVLGFAECVGTSELIEHGVNGYLLSSDESRVDRLAEGLRTMMSDASLRRRLADKGPASVRRFELAPIVDKWEAVLAEVVRERSA